MVEVTSARQTRTPLLRWMEAVHANPFLASKRRPIVVGHRGVPRLHQENTLAGFRRAVELGIPAIELDVRLTADGRPVVVHDSQLDRLTGSGASVIDLTWDQLSRLRVRRELAMGIDATGSRVTVRYEREEPIPLLAEVLAEVGHALAINIELKLDLPTWWNVDIGAIVAQAIADAGLADRVIVTSFDPRKLREVGRARPELAHGFCFDDGMLDFARHLLDRLPPARDPASADRRPGHNARRLLKRILDLHIVGRFLASRVVGAEHTLVGADTVRYLHDRGVAVGTHTLFPIGSTTGKRISPTSSDTREVHRLVDAGVDWIESDDPERLLALIG